MESGGCASLLIIGLISRDQGGLMTVAMTGPRPLIIDGDIFC